MNKRMDDDDYYEEDEDDDDGTKRFTQQHPVGAHINDCRSHSREWHHHKDN